MAIFSIDGVARYSIERSYGLNSQENVSRENSILCGFAFDNKDNHKRITSGENFYILGGSAETHENLVEKILEFNQVIKKYGKKLDNLSEAEFYNIANEICTENKKVYWFYHI
ncbi:MAG: hypothetical protein L6Q53_07215 [Candidatus Brocadia sinica]|uniref:hypothetical protein n=1 Tax=Candidatus Brocadia TaxID=380240 RepID=UPI00138DEB03|nr:MULTISPECIES: hypothetical protein [Brocadia]MCK6467970.1 hypothetical protein [Candidatus Brocadia sinica]NOG43478.1 hypothetical protein [Planctomycetota bacterium]